MVLVLNKVKDVRKNLKRYLLLRKRLLDFHRNKVWETYQMNLWSVIFLMNPQTAKEINELLSRTKKMKKKNREINIELGKKRAFYIGTWARHFVSRNSSYNCFRCLCKVANLVLSPCTSNPPDVSFGSFGLILGEGQDSTIIIDSSNGSSIFLGEKRRNRNWFSSFFWKEKD